MMRSNARAGEGTVYCGAAVMSAERHAGVSSDAC
jgi:hypothetical protein